MKSFIGFCLLLSCQLSIAGDLVVICESENSSIMQELDSTGAELKLPHHDGERSVLQVLPISSKGFSYRFSWFDHKREIQIEREVNVFEEVWISDYLCAVRD